jgi:cell pole-organizing protein PopZ
MTAAAPTRVLVVAHRTAATPRLLAEVRARARRSPCSFTLLVPRPYWDPQTEEAATTLELALPLLDEAAGGHVEGTIGDTDPFIAVEHEVQRRGFDEIIISTLPARVSHWLRRDLPHRVEALGLPVTVVTAKQSERALADAR